ncbi:MAG: DUF1614 domain-containing protein [Firmicutes bacterium]|nr:DUF1614 domain-containing protein [Bacillota bacterium]
MAVMVGIVLLTVATILILAGLAHRVLDRMHLSDRAALVFVLGMIAGSFVEIPLVGGLSPITVNLGGAVLPTALAVYVLARAGTSWERWRAVIAVVVATAVIYGLSKYVNFGEKAMPIEPIYLWAVIAAIVSYLVGRSRRTAFVSATLSMVLLDVVHVVETGILGLRAATRIGGAGAFDAIVLAGILAVILAEVFGEARERLAGGPHGGPDRPPGLGREFGDRPGGGE